VVNRNVLRVPTSKIKETTIVNHLSMCMPDAGSRKFWLSTPQNCEHEQFRPVKNGGQISDFKVVFVIQQLS
jgi:hypothetical protein